MQVKPFRGLRPRPDLASKIPSYPYDVVSTDEARRLAAGDPYSFLHVVKPEIDLDPAIDPHDPNVYERGRSNLQAMIDEGWLVRDREPSYYVYRLKMDDHVQTGVAGAAAVRDYLDGRIKKHEYTRPDKEDDRVRLVEALAAHPGPVFLTYPDVPSIDAQVEAIAAGEPDVSFVAPDGIVHTLWVVADPAVCRRIGQAFAALPATYVADGHHRSAAAARVGASIRARRKSVTGDEAFNFFLAVHFPASQLRILDYNRVIRDLNGLSVPGLLEKIHAAGFEIVPGHAPRRPQKRRSFGMFVEGVWYLLTLAPGVQVPERMPAGLDVALLTERLLQPVLDIGDPRTDRRIDFVGGIRGMDELEKRVNDKRAAVAFALYPTSLAEVMQVADAGEVMPPKSTWFEPKLRSGMVVQTFADDLL